MVKNNLTLFIHQDALLDDSTSGDHINMRRTWGRIWNWAVMLHAVLWARYTRYTLWISEHALWL